MATINSLHKCILLMSPEELTEHFLKIRANRRIKPTKKERAKKSNAKSGRTVHRKKNLSQKDAFSLVKSMSEDEKLALFKKLTGGK